MDTKKPSVLEGLITFSVYKNCFCGAGGIYFKTT